ncbi:nucleoporin NUP159-like [Neltuma alba]|uniref:nucleoporin NUP159-like n=1 Tax=Neltuma alba TaxID=207710 RepID=UPI0010A34FE9|nr:nucleoporin NUP159-like [Prosopis alba]
MAISITRAKAKESSGIEKAKKGPIPMSNSETTPRSIKESTKPSHRSTSNDHKDKTWERRMPSYVKPKTSLRSESQSPSLKQFKSDVATQKPSVNRKPVSDSISYKPKAKEVSSLRSQSHKALVSLGPPHKTPSPLQTSSTSTPSLPKTIFSSKPISKTTLKTPKVANPKPALLKTGTTPKKAAPATRKKVVYAPVNSTNIPESSNVTAKTSRLETVPPATKQEQGALKVEDAGHQDVVEAFQLPPHVDNTEQHECEHEQQHKVEPDQPHIQANDEGAVPSVPEGEPVSVTDVEEAKGKPKGEKTKDEHGDEETTSQGESKNWRHPQEQLAGDGDVEVTEKEKEEGGVIEARESENNNEGKTLKEKKGEETGISEGKTHGDELAPKSEVAEVKTESKPPKEEANVIEETANKLMEMRKNKVKALAGAFQSVIDHQTSSK